MNVYEWIVQAYLQRRGMRFGRVCDSERVRLGSVRRKNFDYVVALDGATDAVAQLDADAGRGRLLEVKGRQFPTGGGSRWENWITRGDLDSLRAWQTRFGTGFTGLLVFAYAVRDGVQPEREWTPITVDNRRFGLVACAIDDNAAHARVRSRKWETVTVAKERFVRLIRPLSEWL